MILSVKPTFLGLLNAIAVGEQRGCELLSAWAAVTPDARLRDTLEFVAAREREHGAAFAKRMIELGYRVRETERKNFEAALALAGSAKRDTKKFRKILGYRPEPDDGEPAPDDPLDTLFDDRSIDPETGALLGRFIAEERDSERRLRADFERLRAQREATSEGAHAAALSRRLERLSATVAELKALRSELA
jgi:rubrerythrin